MRKDVDTKYYVSPLCLSNFPEVRKHRINEFECLVDLLTDFSAGEDNLSTDENQEHNFWFHHAIDETREQFRFVGTEVMMAAGKTFQTDGKLDIARANNILDFKVRKLGIESKFLDDTSVLP